MNYAVGPIGHRHAQLCLSNAKCVCCSSVTAADITAHTCISVLDKAPPWLHRHDVYATATALQADQLHLITLKVQRKYYSEPNGDSQRWISRHDQLLKRDKSLPKQELPATMLSMDYTRVWYTDK